MHEESFVLSELGRLFIDCRALVAQLQAAQKRIAELEAAAAAKPAPDAPSV